MTDSLKSRTITSLAWKLFERAGNQIIQLIVQVVMARLLAPEVFGMLAIMSVFVNVGNAVVQSGLNTALVQALKVDDDDYSTVFWMSFAVSAILYIAVFAVAPAIARFYSMDEIIWPLRIMMLVLVVNALNSVQIAKITRDLEFRKIFRATIVSVVISGGLAIGAALSDAGIWALVVQQLSYQISNCVVLATQVDWKPGFVFKVGRARRLFSFGWKLLASSLLDTGYQSLSDLIVGKQFSAANLGFVSQGKRYPSALGGMLDGAIQPVMLSAVSRVQNDISHARRLVRRALKTSTFLIVPVMGLFALVALPLVRVLLGEQWLPAVPFLQMYCFVYALLPIHTSNLQALNGMGRSDLFLKLEIVKKCYGVCILLFTAFVMRDVYWIVGGYVISGVIGTFINAWPNRKVIGYSYLEQIRDICPAFALTLAAALMSWPISLFAFSDLATILLQAVIMLSAYTLLAKILHLEAFEYLVNATRELFGLNCIPKIRE